MRADTEIALPVDDLMRARGDDREPLDDARTESRAPRREPDARSRSGRGAGSARDRARRSGGCTACSSSAHSASLRGLELQRGHGAAEPACAAARSPCSQRATPTSRSVSEGRAGARYRGGRRARRFPRRAAGSGDRPAGESDMMAICWRMERAIGGGMGSAAAASRRLHVVAVGDDGAGGEVADAARVVAQQDGDDGEGVEQRAARRRPGRGCVSGNRPG